jgi:DNA-binding Xre family transcriptional regulator
LKKSELCKKAGISTASVSKMAKGQNLTVDVLARICTALDCTMDDIVEILTGAEANNHLSEEEKI